MPLRSDADWQTDCKEQLALNGPALGTSVHDAWDIKDVRATLRATSQAGITVHSSVCCKCLNMQPNSVLKPLPPAQIVVLDSVWTNRRYMELGLMSHMSWKLVDWLIALHNICIVDLVSDLYECLKVAEEQFPI